MSREERVKSDLGMYQTWLLVVAGIFILDIAWLFNNFNNIVELDNKVLFAFAILFVAILFLKTVWTKIVILKDELEGI